MKGFGLVAVALVFGQAMVLRAQNPPCKTGPIRISVHDPLGKPVADVHIQIGTDNGVTGSDGIAAFEAVPCGTWTVQASKDGFQDLSDSTHHFNTGVAGHVNLILAPQTVHDSVDVHATATLVEQSSSIKSELPPAEVKNLPSRPTTVTDTLPLVPGIVRSPDGEIKIGGTGEHRSAFVVNQTDVTDPATGKFGQTIPIDSVETVNVYSSSFLPQYGRFTSGVVAVETRRGGEEWHAELNDPLPDFRFRSWHMRGIRDSSPRGVLGGPLMKNRLFLMTTLQYDLMKKPERTLPFPFNESKQESINSFTQLDYIVSPAQIVTATVHVSPQHTNFVRPDFFNPQPTTPSYAQHNYVATLGDHLVIRGGMLDSTISIQRFDATVGSQGDAGMILTPVGSRGNYFGTQNREAGRTEWLEAWSPRQIEFAGAHALKFGSVLTWLSNTGEFEGRPIEIRDLSGLLLRRIEFVGGSPYNRSDLETAGFAQDHWSISSKMALDYGLRFEHQDISGTFRVAPRAGISWTPFSAERTVIRAGYGRFYDRVPLGVYTFTHYPQRLVTDYAPDGTPLGDPLQYQNVLGTAAPNLSTVPIPHAGNFTPRSGNWNIQIEHRISRVLRIRTAYMNSRSAGLVVLEQQFLQANDALQLNGGGRALYRQAEVTGRFSWERGQLFLSYTRSRAQGNLNEFSGFLGNFPAPLIRPNVFSNLPGDLPNRFLGWGRIKLPGGAFLLPMMEYRNGFPYARYDALGNYVGTPNDNRTRFPNFFAADARIMKDFPVNPKYTLRFSVSGFNLTNHFNALSVHANIADPQYGVFFGNYNFRYRADFDVLF